MQQSTFLEKDGRFLSRVPTQYLPLRSWHPVHASYHRAAGASAFLEERPS